MLTADLGTSATLFSAILPGQTDPVGIEARIQLIDSVEQSPADLSDEWQEWREYLDFAKENFESDPGAVVLRYQDLREPADALFDFYTGTCL